MAEPTEIADRRKEPRSSHRVAVILAYGPHEKMKFEAASMIDCSPCGVCIQLNRTLEAGSNFLLKPTRGSTVMLAYKVRRCLPKDDGFEIGAEYSGFVAPGQKTLDPQDVLKMLLAI